MTRVRLEWDEPMLAVHRDIGIDDPGDIVTVPEELLDAYEQAVDAMLEARKALTDHAYGAP